LACSTAFAALAVLVVAAHAAPVAARPIPPHPTVELESLARLTPDGRSVDVDLTASCPERWTIVEAQVTLSQPQASGAAPFSLRCTGGTQLLGVTIQSAGAAFELGEAQATAVLVIQRGRTERAEDSAVVRVVPDVVVDLADAALLDSGGEAVLLDVGVACAAGAAGQESYINVQQGAASGFGFFVPVCDGNRHVFNVRVRASQGLYQPGSAQASAFVQVAHGGDTFLGQAVRSIQIV
jgi:hypothetical protein